MKLQLKDFGAKDNKQLPQRQYDMDCGADVFAPYDWNLEPGITVTMGLGFGFDDLPNGTFALILPRSNLAMKGIHVSPCPIDAGYTKEVHAVLTNMGHDSFYIKEGERIGQLFIACCLVPAFQWEPLKKRGDNGLGSTGK